MDPIAAAMQDFEQDFESFLRAEHARVMHIYCAPQDLAALEKLLRKQEWEAANRHPFLIADSAVSHESDTLETLCRSIKEHYIILRQGLEKEGVKLPLFGLDLPDQAKPADLPRFLERYAELIKDTLEAPFLCWLPSTVQNESLQQQIIELLLTQAETTVSRIILADSPEHQRLEPLLSSLQARVYQCAFEINSDEQQNHVGRLLSPPSKGRSPGTMPGVAAPDVIPPPRPNRFAPDPAETEAIAKELKLPARLTPEQGEQLQKLIMVAAQAAASKNERRALAAQHQACKLCAQSKAELEHALMTLLLATYLLQFQHEQSAERHYRKADDLASMLPAYPQMAQARMALAYLLLKQQRTDEAIASYEQAAAAAVIGGVNLLYFEALRMAGVCHMQAQRKRQAYLCWDAAVRRAETASGDEIRNSGFLQVAEELLKLLRANRYDQRAKQVERLIAQAGPKTELKDK